MRQHQDDPLNNSYADPKYILAVCPAFAKLEYHDAQLLLDTLPVLTEKMMTQGVIYEEDFEDALRTSLGWTTIKPLLRPPCTLM